MMVLKAGGIIVVQNPLNAEAPAMPKAAIEAVNADYIVQLDQVGPLLWTLTRKQQK